MDDSQIWFAFGLTLFAGLSTGVGSLIAFFSKKLNPKFLSLSLGFSAGVMLYVSFVEIFAQAKVSLSLAYGQTLGFWYTTIAFFGGIALIAIIDKLVPSFENPHEMKMASDLPLNVDAAGIGEAGSDPNGHLMRLGVFSAIAIGIHNFPEGLATFIGALQDPALGISIAVAIAIHNIPEGIAVAVPIYFATRSRKKAFSYSFLSGLAEPVGALLGYFLLRTFFSDNLFGFIFAGVAGIMVYISLDELLPTAEKYGQHHIAIWGLIGGMAVMAVSLLMFA